jgi:hypothetical protein
MKHYFTPRQFKHILLSVGFICFSLVLGISGYYFIGDLNFVDAFLNASMILTGMGPVDKLSNPNAKIFASLYSIYSGVAFLTAVGVLLAPAIHSLTKKLEEEHKKRNTL